MRIDSLISVFRHLSQLPKQERNSTDDIPGIVAALEPHGARQIGSFLAKLGTVQKENGVNDPDTQLLRISHNLKTASNIIAIFNEKAGKEMAQFADALCAWSSVEAFQADISRTFAPSPKKPKKEVVDRGSLIRDYQRRLHEHADNNALFDEVVAALSADKTIRIGDMKEIASDFLGYKTTGRSRDEFLRKITDRQALDARHEAKMRSIGG